MTLSICGGTSMDAWLGLPAPKEPRCGNGHREIYMRWRVRRGRLTGVGIAAMVMSQRREHRRSA